MCFQKSQMPETFYRASRFCRVLGNPTAYLIVKCLHGNKLTVSQICQMTCISFSTASMTLRNLRQIDVVRYETIDLNKVYWLKIEDVSGILTLIEELMDELRFIVR